MRIVPAVDIRGGLCVNLVQGDYDQETVFSEDPVAQAVQWRELGGELIHLVDLDGARKGRLCITEQLRALAAKRIPVEVGGGIRDFDTIRTVFDLGAERVILGTAAHRDPDLVRRAAEAFPGKIVVGIDAKEGRVAVGGWLDETDCDALTLAKAVARAGVARIIYTDILRDGMMKGPNLETTRVLAQAAPVPVTASGGMASLEDVRNVCHLEPDGVDEVIIGRALYMGAFTLPEAIAMAQGAS